MMITWKWAAGILIAFVGTLLLLGFASINTQIDRKLDKVVYEADQKRYEEQRAQDRKDAHETKAMVRSIYNWHLPKNLRDKE